MSEEKENEKELYPEGSVYIKWFKGHIPVLLFLLVVVGGLHAWVGVKLAAQPWFCSIMCHEMGIHVETYHKSLHGRVSEGPVCMDCHATPGFFEHVMEHLIAMKFMIPHVTMVYREDGSDRNLHKNVKGFNKEELHFWDKTYLEEQEIFKKCRVCHPNRADKSYFMQPPDHGRMLLNNNCRRCHARIVKLAVRDKVKAKKMLYADSWTAGEPKMLPDVHPLHLGLDMKELVHKYPRLTPYVEHHEGEWQNRIRCTACHSRIVHSTHPEIKHIPGMRRCLRCHADEKVAPNTGCPMCHIGPQNTFLGVKGIGIEETESPMVDNECTSCHNLDKNYKVYLEACAECHDEEAKTVFKEARKEWLDAYKVATKNYEEAERYMTRLKKAGRNMLPYMKLYKRAKYNYLYAARDYSKGIHNKPFTTALFEDANNNFIALLEMLTATRAK